LFAAGIVFGYAAIKPVFIREGAYSKACSKTDDETCVEIHLNLMFTVAAVGTNLAALPVGAILDNFGPRICGALVLTGAFDSSSAVFLVYRIIYNGTRGQFTQKRFFLVYLVVPAFIAIVQVLYMPARSYKTVGELVDQANEAQAANDSQTPITPFDDQTTEGTALLRSERRQIQIEQCQEREHIVDEVESLLGSVTADDLVEAEQRKNSTSGVWGVMHDKTVYQQITSPWFILICLFTIIQMTRINYFVATIRPQYKYLLGDAAKAAEVNDFFDMALPVGGIFAIPLIGMVLDHTSTVAVLSVLVFVASLIGVLGVLPYAWAAYANIILFVLYRPFYYTAVSDYSAKVFGFRTFGTVYGLVICLSGLLNLSQSALDLMFHKTFHGNPVPVNLILLAAGLTVGLSLVVFVAMEVRRRR
jgi:hypothetical protein